MSNHFFLARMKLGPFPPSIIILVSHWAVDDYTWVQRVLGKCQAGRRLNGAQTSKIKVNGVCHIQKIGYYAPGASYTAYPSSLPQTQL